MVDEPIRQESEQYRNPSEIVWNGFAFNTDNAPQGFGWIPKFQATLLFNKGERTLEKWQARGDFEKRITSEGVIEYCIALPNKNEYQANLNVTSAKLNEESSSGIEKSDELSSELIRSLSEVKTKLSDAEANANEYRERNYLLREDLYKLKTQLASAEEKTNDLREHYSTRLKEKDELIAELRDRIVQDKAHIDAEKSRADMASNQLMNANAMIKRREETPAVIQESPELRALKEKLEQLEQKNQDTEALKARIKELESQTWWKRLIKHGSV